MANPFDFKDISAAIQRFSTQNDTAFTPTQTAQQPAGGFDIAKSIALSGASTGGAFDNSANEGLKAGMDLAAMDAKITAARVKAEAAQAKAQAKADKLAAAGTLDKLLADDLGTEYTPGAVAETAMPDKFYGIPTNIRTKDLADNEVWNSLPWADKNAYFDEVVPQRIKAMQAAAIAALWRPRFRAASLR